MKYSFYLKKKQKLLKSDDIEKEFLSIHRRIYNYIQFRKYFPDDIFKRFRVSDGIVKFLKIKCALNWKCLKKVVCHMVPMFEMIRNYRLEYFLPDFITGIEVIKNGVLV